MQNYPVGKELKQVMNILFQDNHEPFCINRYGTGIIDGLNLGATVKFRQLVQGKPIYEICRTFLASLMLVNIWVLFLAL